MITFFLKYIGVLDLPLLRANGITLQYCPLKITLRMAVTLFKNHPLYELPKTNPTNLGEGLKEKLWSSVSRIIRWNPTEMDLQKKINWSHWWEKLILPNSVKTETNKQTYKKMGFIYHCDSPMDLIQVIKWVRLFSTEHKLFFGFSHLLHHLRHILGTE